MRGKIIDIPLLRELSKKYGKTISQIILRWDLQMGIVTIPKSTTPSRIKENAEIFDFQLNEEDVNKILQLNKDIRVGSHPDKVYGCPDIFNK